MILLHAQILSERDKKLELLEKEKKNQLELTVVKRAAADIVRYGEPTLETYDKRIQQRRTQHSL
jgi:hypothetical protein